MTANTNSNKTIATKEMLEFTIRDGWKLGCGCLYLHVPLCVGNNSTFVVISTDRSRTEECGTYHDDPT